MVTRPTEEQIAACQRIAAHMCGTCMVNQRALMDAEPTLAGLDEDDVTPWIEEYGEIFLCDACGWWCETSEMAESDSGQICADCEEDG